MPADRPAGSTGLPTWVRAFIAVASGVLLTVAGVMLPPVANAKMAYGNYAMTIPDRYDFHTWIWMIAPCEGDCVWVRAHYRPIARAYAYAGEARLVDGRYTLTVDDPYGLRCGNVYYGQTIPTHDVYTWDANTFAGTLVSSFDAGCDGQPGTLTYPFWLART